MTDKDQDAAWVDLADLYIGLYVELDLGWMAHPFPTGSFKISTEKQIDTLRGLGLTRIRTVPSKSDHAPVSDSQLQAQVHAESLIKKLQQQAADLQEQQRVRAQTLAAQQQSLLQCERLFAESARTYRHALTVMHSDPKAAAQMARSAVAGFVNEMLSDGESAIRLLSEAAGDKAALHPINVTIVSLLLGKAMWLSAAELQDLGVAAFLHDAGKMLLPERVRWQEDNFSTAELKLFQEHVAQSVQLGKAMELSRPSLLAIAQHHELADGTGFPARIKVESMTAGARILALVNRYDNLCNPTRPGSALTPHESLALIFAQLKTRFDKAALSAFIRMMGVYPPGSVVQLIDDRYGIVVSVNSTRPLKPRVIVHDAGVPRHEALILDLEHAPQLGIRRSVKPVNLPQASLDYLAPRQRIAYFFEQVEGLPPEEPTA
jgi:HD-GYP domain-containing protein (c-di-GMP phosphodiesterase class II)